MKVAGEAQLLRGVKIERHHNHNLEILRTRTSMAALIRRFAICEIMAGCLDSPSDHLNMTYYVASMRNR